MGRKKEREKESEIVLVSSEFAFVITSKYVLPPILPTNFLTLKVVWLVPVAYYQRSLT